MKNANGKIACALALLCLVVPMFASYFFDDMFSTVSQIFQHPESLELGWNSADYGFYAGGYSFLCVCGGLIVCGILLDIYGVRKIGSAFVAMMIAGAGVVLYALLSGLPPRTSLVIAYTGCMLFGLGSEISGVAVMRSIAKWFKGRNVAFAMGLQVAIARLGTASALVLAPMLVASKGDGGIYSLAETARPAEVGLALLLLGGILWAVFVAMDAAFDRKAGIERSHGESGATEDKFKFSDILKLLSNKRFIFIALLCVFFYCCCISFKKFGTAIVIPRFGMEAESARWMISLLPFFTVVFTPLFGALIDRVGGASKWMIAASLMVLGAHAILRFAPEGAPVFGYIGIGILGIGYSLIPSALWPSVPKIVPDKNLGTAYSLLYWIQNIGLMLVPIAIGSIFNSFEALRAAETAEYMFILLAVAAVAASVMLSRQSAAMPELGLDAPNKKK
ncbi:MAG: MFS transporter [Bacteroidales bacterium]|nr:MFS transporter [Bacteroidales bacterium]